MQANRYSLVADIGGTNTRVALADGRRVLPETVAKFRNAEYPALEAVLEAYLAARETVDCAAVCVAIAGPVTDGVGRLTNLDWVVEPQALARVSHAERAEVINDLQAQGHALGHIAESDLVRVLPGKPAAPMATQMVIGVGTGMNAAPVIDTPQGRIVPPAEAGHVSLPMHSNADIALGHFLESEHGFASVEEVLSGRGLELVYRFHCHEAGTPNRLTANQIMTALNEQNDPRAAEAVGTLVRMLGTVAGNLALTCLPFGGIYLIGGVTRAITPYLSAFGFAQAFRAKGRFSAFMDTFPVLVVEDDYAALTGCASYLAGPPDPSQ